ncbi:MAG: hypothetical protein Kow0026_18460 [Oricola sp.]
MDGRTEQGTDLGRRALLLAAAAAISAPLVPGWPVRVALADDGESEGESDGGGESEGESEGDSGGHGGDDGGGGSGSSGSGSGSDGRGDSTGFGSGLLDQSAAERAVRLGEAISLKAALRRVEEAYGGAVIDVNLRSTGKRLEYRFKIRTERGAVRTIRMDARSGRFLGLGALFR